VRCGGGLGACRSRICLRSATLPVVVYARVMPIRISVRVSPGARRTEVVGCHGGGWRMRVAAPPERGRANEALAEHLANVLGVPRGAVRVVAGSASRDKVLEIDGLSAAEVAAALRSGV
jgi:uncharacterized protein